MRKSKTRFRFGSFPIPGLGGGMNNLSMDYTIHEKPDPSAKHWGALAHVDEATRKAIMAAGAPWLWML